VAGCTTGVYVGRYQLGSFEEVWGVKAIAEILAMPGAFGLMAAAEAEGELSASILAPGRSATEAMRRFRRTFRTSKRR